MTKIIINAIQCKHCGEIIESTSAHDFKTCKNAARFLLTAGTNICEEAIQTQPKMIS